MTTPWRVRHFETLPSTSDLCTTLAQAGEPERLAVSATRQTEARGSRGRRWETLPGNLALSVLLRPNDPAAATGHWALLAAVVLAETLEAAGAPALRLKWPNDVMLDGRKLGGILLDAAVDGARLAWLVIGFGANLAAAPDLPGVACLPAPIPPHAAAAALLEHLDRWRRTILVEGFAAVRRAWLERGPAPGTHLHLVQHGAQIGGSFAGLSDQGALLLQSGGRVRAFSTGDVLQGA